jgi:cytoskeletal protein CcmA (bactofilin family)
MANVIQLKRGAESARSGFTPAAGEPIYVTDENKLYIGDGSTAVQSLSALGGDLTMANGSNNRVMTATSSSALNGEANLTFDGSTLAVTGDATVSDDLGLVSDDAQLTFGANSEVKLIHKHNEGLILKHTATADNKPVSLILQTGETDIAADDVLGKLSFQAPDEGTGTDAILVAAEIAAISEGDFASNSNATKMVFRTGSSAAAADRMTLSSGGNLNVTGTITGTGTSVFANLDISGDVDVDGTLETDALSINGTTVSSTAAELNILDGVTATASELNIMDGVTATTAELNIMDGVTSTAAELNILDGVTASAADLNLIDGITNGTVIASKAIITDSNKDISGGRNITISGELDAATGDFSGDVDVDGTLTTDALVVQGNTTVQNILAGAVSNTIQFEGSTADTNETTLGVIDPTGDRTINLPNVSGTIPVLAAVSATQISATPEEINVLDGITATVSELNILDGVTATASELNIMDGVTATTSELNIMDGVTSTTAELNVLDGITAVVGELNALDLGSTAVGTAIASKAVILDSNKDYTGIRNFTITGELDAQTLDIEGNADINGTLETDGLSINGTTVSATAAELNILDGVTATASELNIMDGVTATTAELNKMDGVTATTAELNIMDGVTSTAAELNIMDGNTSATSTTLASADRMVINDAGSMKQVALSDLVTYLEDGGTSGFNVDGGTYS